MATLRVYDLNNQFLTFDLKDLLRLLEPRSLEAHWVVCAVKDSEPGHEWFEAIGDGGKQLMELAEVNAQLSGSALAALAENTRQVIWGEFIGSGPLQPDEAWVTIRAIDSSFYEIETEDETVLRKISSTFKDVRSGKAQARA